VNSQAAPLQMAVALAGGVPQAAQAPAQNRKPELQLRPHDVPSHVAVPLVVPGHAVHEDPQPLTEVFATQALPHRWYPTLQVKSHAVPLQIGVAFAGVVQVAQAPLQSLKPALHVTPHEVPSQVATPLGGTVHAVQDVPQLAVELSARHWLPQRW
jgi:hypothetical protein